MGKPDRRDELKRDIELERKILLKIREEYRPGQGWILIKIGGYKSSVVAEHCKILHSGGLIQGFKNIRVHEDNYHFSIQNMTADGYDYLKTIRDEEDWNRLKEEAERNRIPKTITNFMRLSAIWLANFYKEFNEIP